jgi:hypothetical protein
MAAVANGTWLDCPDDGLAFPPAGLHDLARVFRGSQVTIAEFRGFDCRQVNGCITNTEGMPAK